MAHNTDMWRKERPLSILLRMLPALLVAAILGVTVVLWVTNLMPMSASDWKWWNLLVLMPLPLIVTFVAMYYLAAWVARLRIRFVLGDKPTANAVHVTLTVQQQGFETGTDQGWAWTENGLARFRGYRCDCDLPLEFLADDDYVHAQFKVDAEGVTGESRGELVRLLSFIRGVEFLRDGSTDFIVRLKPMESKNDESFAKLCYDSAMASPLIAPSLPNWPPMEVQPECMPRSELFQSWLLVIGSALGLLAIPLPLFLGSSFRGPVVAFIIFLAATLGLCLWFGISRLKSVVRQAREFRRLFSL